MTVKLNLSESDLNAALEESLGKPEDIFKPNPELTAFMIDIVDNLVKLNPAVSPAYTAYQSVKQTIYNPIFRNNITSNIVSVIYAYYLEVSSYFYTKYTGLDKYRAYNTAAICILTLYKNNPTDRTLYRMSLMTLQYIPEIIKDKHGKDSSISSKVLFDIFTKLSTITLHSKSYIRPAIVKANLHYLEWLVGFLTYWVEAESIAKFNHFKGFSEVFDAIYNRKSVIRLPEE